MSAIYLQADTANGVTIFTDIDSEMEFVSPREFLEALPDMDDGEVIRTIITHPGEPEYSEIKEQYGIH